jgi:hypothetical protein
MSENFFVSSTKDIQNDSLSFARACSQTSDFETSGRTLIAHCLKSLVVAVYAVAEQLAATREGFK